MGTHRFVIEDTEYEVRVGTRRGNSVRVSVNGKDYDVDIAGPDAAAATASPAPSVAPSASAPSSAPAAAPAVSSGGDVRAPISGVVLRVSVKPGQSVSRGAELLILEAMKMENPILATHDGVVQSVDVGPQQDVREGDLLVSIQVG